VKWKRLFSAILAGGLLLAGGTTQIVSAEIAPATSAGQLRYVRRAQEQIDALVAGLHKADMKLDHLDADRRKECNETLKHLWQKERLARVKLQGIRDAAPDQWQTLRPAEDSLLIHLQKSYQHLVNRYFK
jgi:hypothetical protein